MAAIVLIAVLGVGPGAKALNRFFERRLQAVSHECNKDVGFDAAVVLTTGRQARETPYDTRHANPELLLLLSRHASTEGPPLA
jgi:hypothetical protein